MISVEEALSRFGLPQLWNVGRAIGFTKAQIPFRVSQLVTKQAVVPAYNIGNSFGIWIYEQLIWIEPVALPWFIGTMHPVAVKLAGAGLGQITMPDVV